MKTQKKTLAVLLSLTLFVSSFVNSGLAVQAKTVTDAAITAETKKTESTDASKEAVVTSGKDVIVDGKKLGYSSGLTEDLIENREEKISDDITEEVLAEVQAGNTSSLPKAVDNTGAMGPNGYTYFPEIGNQKSVGSCWAWSEVYYLMTYTLNRDLNRPVSDENTFSPKYNYYLHRFGSLGEGMPENCGAMTLQECPLDYFDTESNVDTHPLNLNMSEEEQVKILSREPEWYGVDASTNEGIQELKSLLSEGEIFTFTVACAWDTNKIPVGYSHEGEYIIKAFLQGPGVVGHALTIVGYDDTIGVDLDGDGKIASYEKGAFKVANSWGKNASRSNDGFYWVSYDAFLTDYKAVINTSTGYSRQSAWQVSGIRMPNKTPEFYVAVTVEEEDRSQLDLSPQLQIGNHGYSGHGFRGSGNFSGLNLSCKTGKEENVIVMDLNQVTKTVCHTNSKLLDETWSTDWITKYTWAVYCDDAVCDDGKGYTLKSVRFVDTVHNITYGTKENVSNVVLNCSTSEGNGYTYHTNGSKYVTMNAQKIIPSISALSMNKTSSGVTLTASATDDKSNLKYRFYLQDEEGKEIVISDYSTASTVNYSGLSAGTYTVCVDVKDSDENVVTKKVTSVYKPFEVTKITPSVKSGEITEGTSVTFTASTNSNDEIQYEFVLNRNNTKKILQAYSNKNTCKWISEYSPYTTTIQVNAKNITTGETASKNINYVVNPEQRGITVYYKNQNWSTAYIHYKTENGQWTSVPGVPMKTSDLNGYTWKYEIPVYTDNSNNATVCFNNGNGSWDSKNGANYNLGIGTYGIKNQTIETLDFTVTSFTASKSSPIYLSDANFDLRAEASYGSGSYEYQFGVKFNGKTYYCSTDYSELNFARVSLPWLITTNSSEQKNTVGAYTLFVNIRDTDTKEIATKTIENFEILPMTVSLSADTTGKIKVGTAVHLTANVQGEATYRYNSYRFYVIKDGVETQLDPYNIGTTYTKTWTPTEPGNYTIKYYISDNYGQVAIATKDFNVVDNNTTTVYYNNNSWTKAYVHYKVDGGEWTTVPGVQMDSSSEQSGYTWKYEIDLADASGVTVCFNNGSGFWDSKNGSNYYLGTGTYGIKNSNIYELSATPTPTPAITPTVTPTPTAKNIAYVYYNTSWSQPYVHFKVGNGNWTTVPGVQMTANNNAEGYQWVYAIDLGTSDYATICFNNGNGSWDSDNGKNYTIYAGNYGISNGTVSKLSLDK